MPEHSLSPTTRTLDLVQVAELDGGLSAPNARPVTAGDLGLDEGVAPTAVLTRVWCEGSPEFPYIYGDFAGASGSAGAAVHVLLHTAALRALSQAFGLHHRWGV